MFKLKFLFIAMCLVSFLVSCSKDDTKEETPVIQPCQVKTLKETLIGKWKMTANGFLIEFKSDNTYIDSNNFFNKVDPAKGPYKFKYIVNGSKAELEAIGTADYYEDFKVDRFVCDTLFITRPGFSKTPLVRQK